MHLIAEVVGHLSLGSKTVYCPASKGPLGSATVGSCFRTRADSRTWEEFDVLLGACVSNETDNI